MLVISILEVLDPLLKWDVLGGVKDEPCHMRGLRLLVPQAEQGYLTDVIRSPQGGLCSCVVPSITNDVAKHGESQVVDPALVGTLDLLKPWLQEWHDDHLVNHRLLLPCGLLSNEFLTLSRVVLDQVTVQGLLVGEDQLVTVGRSGNWARECKAACEMPANV